MCSRKISNMAFHCTGQLYQITLKTKQSDEAIKMMLSSFPQVKTRRNPKLPNDDTSTFKSKG